MVLWMSIKKGCRSRRSFWVWEEAGRCRTSRYLFAAMSAAISWWPAAGIARSISPSTRSAARSSGQHRTGGADPLRLAGMTRGGASTAGRFSGGRRTRSVGSGYLAAPGLRSAWTTLIRRPGLGILASGIVANSRIGVGKCYALPMPGDELLYLKKPLAIPGKQS